MNEISVSAFSGPIPIAAIWASRRFPIRRSFCSRRYRAGPASGSTTRCGERAAAVAACSTRDGTGFRSGPYGRFWAAIFPFAKGCLANPLRQGRRCSHSIFCGTIWSPTSGPATVIRHLRHHPLRNMDFTKSWARRLRRQYILLPQTIGPYASEEARRKAARSMSAAGLIFARDRMSFDCARELLPPKPVERTIDAAFFLPYEKTAFDGEKTKVGINISGLLWHGGYTRNNQFGLRSDYSRTMLGILDAFSSRQDVELHLISHVIGRPDFVDEDTHVVGKLRARYPRAIVAPAFRTPVEAKSYIAGMDFFAGARMHACIAAVSSGVPVYPLAYSRKFNGLFVETLGYPEMGDLTVMDSDEITAGLLAAFGRSDLKKRIEQIDRQIVGPEKERMIGKLSEYILRNEF
ncbi:MAG: polysaccharide pyruvyl transferase family protein [Alistipes ihumii]